MSLILNLPTELKIKIIHYLAPEDVLILSRSCKAFRSIVLATLQCKECHQYKKHQIAFCHLAICYHHFICKDCLLTLLQDAAIHLHSPQIYKIKVTVKNNICRFAIHNPYESRELMNFYHHYHYDDSDNDSGNDGEDENKDNDESFYADSDDEPYMYFVSKLLA
ncbi:unnamed protein product [Cunninghamella blakesleeana]